MPDEPGEGARILAGLQEAGINLIDIAAFPHGARRSQLDLIPEDGAAFTKATREAELKLSTKKSGLCSAEADNRSLVLFASGDEVEVQAGDNGVRFLLVSGRPLAEPACSRTLRGSQVQYWQLFLCGDSKVCRSNAGYLLRPFENQTTLRSRAGTKDPRDGSVWTRLLILNSLR